MSLFKKIFKGVKSILGLDDSAERAARAQARAAEEQLRRAQEAQKLQAANEMQSVTTVENVELGSSLGTDTRRRRRTAGSATSNLGLNV